MKSEHRRSISGPSSLSWVSMPRAFIHQWRHPEKQNLGNLAVPLLGFLICGFIWIHLSGPALMLGTVWMAAGIAYGAIRTRGFRSELVSFRDSSGRGLTGPAIAASM